MSKQPLSTAFRNKRGSIQVLDCHRRLCSPTCQQSLFFRSNGVFITAMNIGDDSQNTLLQLRHPAVVARHTNVVDFHVNVLGVSPWLSNWLSFNKYCAIHEDSFPWWGREQWRKPSTKDMLFSNRLPTAKDASSWHMLYCPYGEEYGKETKNSKGARDTRAHERRVRAKSKKGSTNVGLLLSLTCLLYPVDHLH
jgi:hypothetical protein